VGSLVSISESAMTGCRSAPREARGVCCSISLLEPVNVDGEPTLTGHQFSQIEREAWFVGHPERERARDFRFCSLKN